MHHRTAVPVYVAVVAFAAIACLLWAGRNQAPLPASILGFMAMAAVTDLREIRLPGVGLVTLSFVPTLAALMVFGLWPALLVSVISGGGALWLTHDPQKVVLNVGNFVVSTFLAGTVYLALVSSQGFAARILPAYCYAAVDFAVTTIVLAGVIGLASGDHPLRVWRKNYQWGLLSYVSGAALALLVAWLYLQLGFAGLLLGLPPLYLIYYSYEVYVVRARERESHGAQVASFEEELRASARLHEQLASTQRKVAAEIERARRIQLDLLPAAVPEVPHLEIAQRIEFLDEMGGDYFDYLAYADGRLGIICGDVMGKGLAAALIMAMARSAVHNAAAPGLGPSQVLARVNDALARDLQGQALPYFVTAAYVVFDPRHRTLTVASGGHNPILLRSSIGVSRIDAQGPMLGVRPGLVFPEERIDADAGDLLALYTDGITEARRADGEQFGVERLAALLDEHGDTPLTTLLEASWKAVDAFREGRPRTDDATLLLLRLH